MSVATWIALVVLGGVGAVFRFRIDAFVGGRVSTEFPLGTFAINAVGTFALGILTGAQVASDAVFIVGTGLVGSFTTFSTWMFETERLAGDGEAAVSAANIGVSLAVGLAAGALGWGMGALL
jgi:CrcB protein